MFDDLSAQDPLIAELVASRARSHVLLASAMVVASFAAAVVKVSLGVMPLALLVGLTLVPLVGCAVAVVGTLLAMKAVLLPVPEAAGMTTTQRAVPVVGGVFVLVVGGFLVLGNALDMVTMEIGAIDEELPYDLP